MLDDYWKSPKVQRKAKYNGFGELADYFKEVRIALKMAKIETLTNIGVVLKAKIKNKYGVQQPWYPLIGSNPTPLLDTGELKEAVRYKKHGNSGVEVYVSKRIHPPSGLTTDHLASIHEFGNMTGAVNIPERAIWRPTAMMETPKIIKSIERGIYNFFN